MEKHEKILAALVGCNGLGLAALLMLTRASKCEPCGRGFTRKHD